MAPVPFAPPPGAPFARQMIFVPSKFHQYANQGKLAHAQRSKKRKAKYFQKPIEPCIQTIFREDHQNLVFAAIMPNIVKPTNQMQPEDYSMHAIGIDLSRVRPQDRVEIMEESNKVVSSDYLKHVS